jgi:hypothetical protein
MDTNLENTVSRARTYRADALPKLQDLLAALADLDLAYETDLEVVRNSGTDEDLKQIAIQNLERLYHQRRKPVVRHLEALSPVVKV